MDAQLGGGAPHIAGAVQVRLQGGQQGGHRRIGQQPDHALRQQCIRPRLAGELGQQGVRAQLGPAGCSGTARGGQRDFGLPPGQRQLVQPMDRAARADAPRARRAEPIEQGANRSPQPFALLSGPAGDDHGGPPGPAGGQRPHASPAREKPFDVKEDGAWRHVLRGIVWLGPVRGRVPDQQHRRLAVAIKQAPVGRLVLRHGRGCGVLAEQSVHQLRASDAVLPAGQHPGVQQHADLGRGARGIGHLLPGEIPEPVGDPHEALQQPPAPDRHAQPLPQLHRRVLRHVTGPGQEGDLLVAHVLRPRPAVQQRPHARRVRIAEVLARGDQPQLAVIDEDSASKASGKTVRQCLNVLDAHSPPSAMSVRSLDHSRYGHIRPGARPAFPADRTGWCVTVTLLPFRMWLSSLLARPERVRFLGQRHTPGNRGGKS